MYPNLFGIDGFSMTFMIIIGVIAAAALLFVYLHKNGVHSNSFLDLGVVVIVTVIIVLCKKKMFFETDHVGRLLETQFGAIR